MKPSETSRALAKLKAAWPRQPIDKETIEVYAQALAPFPFEPIAHAITTLIRTATFFPTVAEILRTAAAAMLQAPPPAEAWGAVIGQVRSVGLYGTPEFPHELVREAVREIGGYRRLCESRDTTSDRARFHEAYRELITEHVREFATNDLALPNRTEPKGLTE